MLERGQKLPIGEVIALAERLVVVLVGDEYWAVHPDFPDDPFRPVTPDDIEDGHMFRPYTSFEVPGGSEAECEVYDLEPYELDQDVHLVYPDGDGVHYGSPRVE